MNFVHISILAGLGAMAIPLALHLLGRREPQLIDFPALRFVRETQLEDSRSWRLRHMLLLFLRLLLLAILVVALARPRVHSAMIGSVLGIVALMVFACVASLATAVARTSHRPVSVWGTLLVVAIGLWLMVALWGFYAWTSGPALPNSDPKAPVAAVIIMDTSPSMAYQSNNQTRLEAAREMASWLLDRLPADSHVGILSGLPMSSLSLDPRSADAQLALIRETTERVDLPSRLRTALDLVLADELERKEIYLLTDMNSAAWEAPPSDLINRIGSSQEQVLIQFIDVGVKGGINWQLGDPQIDFHTVPVGGEVTVRIPVVQSSEELVKENSCTIELWQESLDPRLPVIEGGRLKLPESQVVSREVVELSGDGAIQIELKAGSLPEGTHHFSIRIDKNDPLPIDNQRFFSITARRQQPTLIVADDPEIQRILSIMIDPKGGALSQPSSSSGSGNGATSGLIASMRYSQLPQAALTRYEVVVLYDMPTLAQSVVESLAEHVQGGGGLLVVLGPSLEAVLSSGTDTSSASGLGGSAIAALLPGVNPRLISRAAGDRTGFWEPTSPTHPIYQELEFSPSEIAWQLMPVFKSWSFDSLHPSTQTLASLTNSSHPLMTAQSMGRGQILTLLTPIPELEQLDRPLWNEMWIAEQYWWAFGILSGSLRTLSGADQTPITFTAGTPIHLANDPRQWPSRWELYTPSARRVSLQTAQGALSVGTFSQPGNYHLRGNLGVPVARGFSVNLPASDTNLQWITTDSMDALLGEGSYRVARGQDEVSSSVGRARFGQELYPLLMLFVAGLFLAEQFMSNRFYQIHLKFGKGLKK